MNVDLFAENPRPAEVLDALIARHGVLRVILALPAALVKRRRPALSRAEQLSDHLHRDIGLHDEAPRRSHWELR